MAGLVDVALQAVTDKQEALVRSKAATEERRHPHWCLRAL